MIYNVVDENENLMLEMIKNDAFFASKITFDPWDETIMEATINNLDWFLLSLDDYIKRKRYRLCHIEQLKTISNRLLNIRYWENTNKKDFISEDMDNFLNDNYKN